MTVRKYRFSLLFSLLLAMALSVYCYNAYGQSFDRHVYLPAVLRFCDGVNCDIGDPVRCDIDCDKE